MTHQGRLHVIHTPAEQAAVRLVAAARPLAAQMPQRLPILFQIRFPDTAEERYLLTAAAKRYNSFACPDDQLVAHGTESAMSLCQILQEGEVRHGIGFCSYGQLHTPSDGGGYGGYWDRGWGIFVTKQKYLPPALDKQLIVPLHSYQQIVLPSPLVPLVQKEFPQYAHLIRGYRHFAKKIDDALSS